MCSGAGDAIVFLVPAAVIATLVLTLLYVDRRWKTGRKWLLVVQAIALPIVTWFLAGGLAFSRAYDAAFGADCSTTWVANVMPVLVVASGLIVGAIPWAADRIAGRRRAA